jgi:hypothetical protein
MKLSRYSLRAAILAFAVVSFTAPKPSHADTYQIYDFGAASHTGIVGITDSDLIVLFQIGCSGFNAQCYIIDSVDALVGTSTTNPDLPYDNGTPCPILPVGAIFSRCNNGHEVLGQGRGFPPITNPPPNAVILDSPLIDLNSFGDYFGIVGIGEIGIDLDGELVVGIDITSHATPEPASIALVGTGILAALGSMRRRQQQK